MGIKIHEQSEFELECVCGSILKGFWTNLEDIWEPKSCKNQQTNQTLNYKDAVANVKETCREPQKICASLSLSLSIYLLPLRT